MQCEKTAAFSLQSILNQVLKPLDVKTKFYNAEVSVRSPPPLPPQLNELCSQCAACLMLHSIFNIHN